MGLLRGVSIMMGTSMIMLVLSFINNKLVYTCIDEKSNGLYFLVVRASMLVTLLAGEWLRLSNLNIAGRDRNLTGILTSNSLWYSLALGLSLILVIALFTPLLSGMLSVSAGLLYVAAAAAVLSIIRDTSLSLLLVNQRIVHYGLAQLIMGSTFLGLDILFLVVFRFGMEAVIVAWLASLVGAAVWAFSMNVARHGFPPLPSPAIFRESRGIGMRACIATVGMFLMVNIHAFAIEPITRGTGKGLVMVAVFSVCFRSFQLLQRFSDVTGSFLISNVVQRDKNAGFQLTALSVRNIVLLSLVLSMVGMLLGRELIVFVADARYMGAYIPLLIMLPGIVAINAGSLINGFYWGHGYPYRITLASVAAAAVGLLLDILLIPRWGVSGATFSFTMVSVVWMAYLTRSFCRESGMRFHEVLVPRYSDIALAASRFGSVIRRGQS